jgi:acyl-CoA ligase (AMP-forming) (exosortase A-associated)
MSQVKALVPTVVADLPLLGADRWPQSIAVGDGDKQLTYAELAADVERFAAGLIAAGLAPRERVGIYLEKRFEFVIAAFGAARAGLVFVPVNPLLKAEQVEYILRDCNVRVLVTSPERLRGLREALSACPDLRTVVVTGTEPPAGDALGRGAQVLAWPQLLDTSPRPGHRHIDTDMAAILYTSGSTGRPKGVVLSHRNLVAGALSVASYLGNHPGDRLLAALPLSFDAGFSQITTAFASGASVHLINYLLPRDVLDALQAQRITGLTAVPPLWIQLTQIAWPASIDGHLRYIANTGGKMPRETLRRLRERVPKAQVFLMYGLTEAFRSTYLPPTEVDRRPDSIGKAIPNAEILVLREDGSACAPNEPGELVHRGALVGMGYWNDPEKTAERYKPLPRIESGLVIPELAVFSGDTVRRDEDGFIYFIGRRDEMIKTSGYRLSPTEIEETIYGSGLAGEVAAFGVEHPVLGQAVVVVATPPADGALQPESIAQLCKAKLPAYMVPAHVDVRPGPLPRNPNGKIDRKKLSGEFAGLFADGN